MKRVGYAGKFHKLSRRDKHRPVKPRDALQSLFPTTCMAMLLTGIGAPALAERTRSDNSAMRKCAKVVISDNGIPDRRTVPVTVEGHDFRCQQAAILHRRDGSFKVSGRIVHVLRFRPDDVIRYSYVVDRCTWQIDYNSLQFSMERGGLAPAVGALGRLIHKDNWENDWRSAAEDWDGEWEYVATELIVYAGNNFARFAGLGRIGVPEGCEASSGRPRQGVTSRHRDQRSRSGDDGTVD